LQGHRDLPLEQTGSWEKDGSRPLLGSTYHRVTMAGTGRKEKLSDPLAPDRKHALSGATVAQFDVTLHLCNPSFDGWEKVQIKSGMLHYFMIQDLEKVSSPQGPIE
jgi:hypothetical protein